MSIRIVTLSIILLAARAAAADVVVRRVGVEVAATDGAGKKWDRGLAEAPPDPKIDIRIDGKSVHACDAVKNSFTAACALPDGAPHAGLSLELDVVDQDLLDDDDIGHAAAQIRADARGRIELPVSGRLTHAWVEVDWVAPPRVRPPVAMAIALAAGLAVPLLLLALLRRRFLSPTIARAREPALAPSVGTAPRLRYWRSPALLFGTIVGVAGIFVAGFVDGAAVDPLIAAIPMAMGAAALGAAIIDAFAHEHLAPIRAAVAITGALAILAVPAFHAFGGVPGVIQGIIGVMVLIGMLIALVK